MTENVAMYVDGEVGKTVAAIDLGTNSFHLVIARFTSSGLVVLDRLRETVRLGGGLNIRNELSAASRDKGLRCLHRFAQRLKNYEIDDIRVVGTYALRIAKHNEAFLNQAQEILGRSIDIISGQEEARLIYLGVVNHLPVGNHKRLILDIGGGSTEIVIGEGARTLCLESFPVGCVSLSDKYFAHGKIGQEIMQDAQTYAEKIMQPHVSRFREYGWSITIGCSGTIRAVQAVMMGQGICGGDISATGLGELKQMVSNLQHTDQLGTLGVDLDRRPIFASGLAVLCALFTTFGLESMDVSEQALREGVLYDLG